MVLTDHDDDWIAVWDTINGISEGAMNYLRREEYLRLEREVSSFWQRLNWIRPVVVDSKSILHVAVGLYADLMLCLFS